MRKPSWNFLFCICLLLPAAAIADDTFDKLYESRWQLSHTLDTATYLSESAQLNTAFDIAIDDESSSLLRMTKIRSLSFFTLSGDDRSKWFLGINEDGLVGIHFRGFTRSGARRHLDVASIFASKDDDASDDSK